MKEPKAGTPSRPTLHVDTGAPGGYISASEDEDFVPGEDYCCETCDRMRRRRRRARRREMAAQEAVLRARLAASHNTE